MKMTKDDYVYCKNFYKRITDELGMDLVHKYIKDTIDTDNRIKNRDVAIAFAILWLDASCYDDVICKQYDKGLNDDHLKTAFVKICKELGISA